VAEKLAFSMALDLLFNGQNMDYCERPISLSVMDEMAMFSDLPRRAHVGVIGPGGGRLIKTLVERGYTVDAYEGRKECLEHLERMFVAMSAVNVYPAAHLDDPMRRERMKFDALFCMDDLRSFRESREWTEYVQRMVREEGYFVYSQVSNKLPSKQNTLKTFFELTGNYNVSEETAAQIREIYLELNKWEPDEKDRPMALSTLDMVRKASGLRRSIMSEGVEVRYVVWRKKPTRRKISKPLMLKAPRR
jgi:phospholipid N-methyltransferase